MEPGSVKSPDCQATLWQHIKSKVKPEKYNWQVGAESGPAITASVRHSPVIERQGHSESECYSAEQGQDKHGGWAEEKELLWCSL